MKSIQLTEFEANCHFFLEQVEQSGEALTLLKDGAPFTRILPYHQEKPSLFGLHQDDVRIEGDIMAPIDVEWDAMARQFF